jgi:hypothetical protein
VNFQSLTTEALKIRLMALWAVLVYLRPVGRDRWGMKEIRYVAKFWLEIMEVEYHWEVLSLVGATY